MSEIIKELEKLQEWANVNNSDIWEPQGFIGNFIETKNLENYIASRIADLKNNKDYDLKDMLDDLDIRPLGD